MARPIPDASSLSRKLTIDDEIKPSESKSFVEITVHGIKSKPTKNLVLGTFSGWLAGVAVVRVGKVAAFGLGGGVILLHFASEGGYIDVNWERVREAAGRSQVWAERLLRFVHKHSCYSVGFIGGFFFAIQVVPAVEHERLLPPEPVPPKPPETYRPADHAVFDKPTFLPPKPISHSPKISPSSIPIPNPSVTTNKQVEAGYPGYGGYLYSVPGFSAFQPVSYPGVMQPNQAPIHNEPSTEFQPFANVPKDLSSFQKEPYHIRESFSPAKDTFPTIKDEFPSAIRKDPFLPVSKECSTSTPVTDSYPPGSGESVFTPVTIATGFPTPPTKEHIPFPPIPTRESVNLVNVSTSSSTVPTSTKEQITLVSIKDTVYPPLPSKDHISFSAKLLKATPTQFSSISNKCVDERKDERPQNTDIMKNQTDFEEKFTTEIIPTGAISENNKTQSVESKMSITSLTQGSGATVTIPTQVTSKDMKKKPTERFSLKTSIPISKIDIKCMNTSSDSLFHSFTPKKTFNPVFLKETPKIEIQSNVVIKSATKETETKTEEHNTQQTKNTLTPTKTNNSISTLINAAEAINKTESQFQFRDPKSGASNEIQDSPPALAQRPKYNAVNIEASKVNFNKPPDGPYTEQKNQILFIQNKSSQNPKMLLTIQQQNPQVLLQRTNFDPKNLQAPSRLSNQAKKSKEEIMNDCSSSSKVVALKRLHQENCDENDFENLITENQIYGNKIVVKEKSQGILQEQDLKSKKIIEKPAPTETKTTNVVIQPNIVYLSNVQFPNLMMIKNNTKIAQTTDCNVTVTSAENKTVNEASTMTNNDLNIVNNTSQHNVAISKEIHVLNSSNNMIQTIPNITKPEVLITNQKVIMNPQILYQMPMIVDSNKINQPFTNRDYPNLSTQTNELPKQFDQSKANEKLYIACPYQMDSKLQPKIVITNIRPKIPKLDEVSELDYYEKRKRMRRLKYLSNRDVKDVKTDFKKVDKTNVHVITPDKMKNEIIKEFANTKVHVEDGCSESESDDYGEDELNEYDNIIEQYSAKVANDKDKAQFLANFSLGTLSACKEKKMEIQEKVLKYDAVAAAYVAIGRLVVFPEEAPGETPARTAAAAPTRRDTPHEEGVALHRKQMFLSRLRLKPVTQQYKEGYENVWQEIIKERKRRNGGPDTDDGAKQPKTADELNFDPNSQLRMLSEIKKSVNENNNLIKKRLDAALTDSNDDSIRVLADKNFSELNRLSKMADRSVKLLSGQDTKKRDLNPGFDSENIQRNPNNEPKINIPNISKIVSLKTTPECHVVRSTQATSMDEPRNSAAGAGAGAGTSSPAGSGHDVSCQAQELPAWLGIKTLMASYKEFEAGRKRTIVELHRRNTALRVASSHITRGVSQDADCARALLAERRHLAAEEAALRHSVQRLCAAVHAVRHYS